MTCHEIDELGAAFALEAVDADDRRTIEEHLVACVEPHADVRSAIGAGAVLAASAEPVEPSPALRARLMATVAATAQEHAPSPAPVAEAPARGWLPTGWWRGLALGGVAAALVLAVATGALWTQLQGREAELRAAVAAVVDGGEVHRIDSESARGYLVETPDGATLILGDVAGLPEDRLYELWLIDPGGAPLDVGVFRPDDDALVVVELERGLEGFVAFAVTIESERVAAPTGDPILATPLEG